MVICIVPDLRCYTAGSALLRDDIGGLAPNLILVPELHKDWGSDLPLIDVAYDEPNAIYPIIMARWTEHL